MTPPWPTSSTCGTRHGDDPAEREWEWFVHAFAGQGPQPAEQLVATVRAWDRDVRGGSDPRTSPSTRSALPIACLPPGDVLDKPCSRLVFRWPGRDARLPAPVERGEAVASIGEGA
ncbi:hypothetical protein ACFXPI_17855 [Streptomyces sp. NPDC059104]|uniref:hypothetical protein n=1 Tax=Streptomyces sp. NPDC059104 TaxID=3346729 RepID=UPI003682869B